MSTNKKQIACQKIISGGQTGVDRGALDACLDKNFPCGGWCPKGRLAEDGKINLKYPLMETENNSYNVRTSCNVLDSDGTLIIAQEQISGGTLLTQNFAREVKKPVLVISPKNKQKLNTEIEIIQHWLNQNNISVLNVAGPRKSEWESGYDVAFNLISELIG